MTKITEGPVGEQGDGFLFWKDIEDLHSHTSFSHAQHMLTHTHTQKKYSIYIDIDI